MLSHRSNKRFFVLFHTLNKRFIVFLTRQITNYKDKITNCKGKITNYKDNQIPPQLCATINYYMNICSCIHINYIGELYYQVQHLNKKMTVHINPCYNRFTRQIKQGEIYELLPSFYHRRKNLSTKILHGRIKFSQNCKTFRAQP